MGRGAGPPPPQGALGVLGSSKGAAALASSSKGKRCAGCRSAESWAHAALMSRSGGEKGLRGSGAGTLGVPLGGTRRVGGLLGVAGRLSGTTGISAFPLDWPWEAQSSPRVAIFAFSPAMLSLTEGKLRPRQGRALSQGREHVGGSMLGLGRGGCVKKHPPSNTNWFSHCAAA